MARGDPTTDIPMEDGSVVGSRAEGSPTKENTVSKHDYHTMKRTVTTEHPLGGEKVAHTPNVKTGKDVHIHLRGGAGYKGEESVVY